LPLLVFNRIIFKRGKDKSVKQSGVYPRKNETKVITINGITQIIQRVLEWLIVR